MSASRDGCPVCFQKSKLTTLCLQCGADEIQAVVRSLQDERSLTAKTAARFKDALAKTRARKLMSSNIARVETSSSEVVAALQRIAKLQKQILSLTDPEDRSLKCSSFAPGKIPSSRQSSVHPEERSPSTAQLNKLASFPHVLSLGSDFALSEKNLSRRGSHHGAMSVNSSSSGNGLSSSCFHDQRRRFHEFESFFSSNTRDTCNHPTRKSSLPVLRESLRKKKELLKEKKDRLDAFRALHQKSVRSLSNSMKKIELPSPTALLKDLGSFHVLRELRAITSALKSERVGRVRQIVGFFPQKLWTTISNESPTTKAVGSPLEESQRGVVGGEERSWRSLDFLPNTKLKTAESLHTVSANVFHLVLLIDILSRVLDVDLPFPCRMRRPLEKTVPWSTNSSMNLSGETVSYVQPASSLSSVSPEKESPAFRQVPETDPAMRCPLVAERTCLQKRVLWHGRVVLEPVPQTSFGTAGAVEDDSLLGVGSALPRTLSGLNAEKSEKTLDSDLVDHLNQAATNSFRPEAVREEPGFEQGPVFEQKERQHPLSIANSSQLLGSHIFGLRNKLPGLLDSAARGARELGRSSLVTGVTGSSSPFAGILGRAFSSEGDTDAIREDLDLEVLDDNKDVATSPQMIVDVATSPQMIVASTSTFGTTEEAPPKYNDPGFIRVLRYIFRFVIRYIFRLVILCNNGSREDSRHCVNV